MLKTIFIYKIQTKIKFNNVISKYAQIQNNYYKSKYLDTVTNKHKLIETLKTNVKRFLVIPYFFQHMLSSKYLLHFMTK